MKFKALGGGGGGGITNGDIFYEDTLSEYFLRAIDRASLFAARPLSVSPYEYNFGPLVPSDAATRGIVIFYNRYAISCR